MKFYELPDEIKLSIFYYLSSEDTFSIVPYLPKQDRIVASERLFRKHIVILNKPDWLKEYKGSTIIFIQYYKTYLEQTAFVSIIPRRLTILLSPDNFEFDEFDESNRQFNDLLNQYQDYFKLIPEVELSIHAYHSFGDYHFHHSDTITQTIETSSNIFATNLTHLNLNDCQIGETFPRWGSQLHKFEKLTTLILQKCGIESSYLRNNDIFGSLKYPPALQNLAIVNNNLRFISTNLINNLPKTIRNLSFNDNLIGIFDIPNLNLILPNLISLNLSGNYLSVFVNSSNFTRPDFRLGLFTTFLDLSLQQSLVEQSANIRFTIFGLM